MPIRIGTSGFSYDDWKGHFYPTGMKRGDMLAYYARVFPSVEINSTYYRLPPPRTMVAMAQRVPAGFRFAVKAHANLTHGEVPSADQFRQFRECLEPLEDAGMLGCALVQFPWGFGRTPESVAHIRRVRDGLGGIPLVLEFRNSGWVSDGALDETTGLLRELDCGFCCVDEPRLKGLLPPVTALTSRLAYVRFHGRNAEKWWHHDHPWERYNYLYSAEELQEWRSPVLDLAREAQETFVFFNNHYLGNAAENARAMADLLELPLGEPGLTGDAGTLALEFD
jgi:uncharacterized protein YecE (DUF72 family)